jgi:hypothetical protein
VNIPFNVQIKAGKQANMNPGKELLSMQHCVDLMFTKGEDPVTINLIY